MATLSAFFIDDHIGLWALLRQAMARPGQLEGDTFGVFRAELLRHIALEDMMLASLRRVVRSETLPLVHRLRVEHRAIASFFVAEPTPALATEIVSILKPHRQAEEEGLYPICDQLLGSEAGELLRAFENYPPVAIAAGEDAPGPHQCAADALAAATRSLRGE
jgi:hypothetical protein